VKIHLDLDCFFAAAHRINNPSLEGIPIAVGGKSNISIFDKEKHIKNFSKINGAFTSTLISSPENKNFKEYFIDTNGKIRGVVTTSSYEARAYGVKTAMSVAEALRICPHLTMIPPNYPLYHDLSNKLKLLLDKEIPTIEQASIDEFFGDVTGWIEDKNLYQFGIYLKQKVKDELGLPISVGIAKTKWIAKLATNDAKPHGVKLVLENEVIEFVKEKPIGVFPGIGRVMQEKLLQRGIKTLGDILNKKALFYSWGKSGQQIYDRIAGIDDEEINVEQNRKSIGLGRSFDPLFNRDEIKRRLVILSRHLSFIAYEKKHQPSRYSLKIKYQYGAMSNANINTNRIFTEQYLKNEISNLFDKIDNHPSHAITHLNINLSNFQKNKPKTLDLFHYEEDQKQLKLNDSMQKLRDKFGVDIIKNATEL